jgi:YbbR domain-containing protein
MKFKITRNLGLKIAALIFSVFFWIIVININDPVDNVTYANIPVEFINGEVVTNKGKTYDLVGEQQPVRVTVSGKRSVLSKVRSSNIVATADLSQMEVNTYLVPISAEVRGLEGENVTTQVSPGNLEVKIEATDKHTFPISVNTSNITTRNGYAIGEVSVNPEMISTIRNIHRVVAKVDAANGLSESTTLSAELVLHDGNDNVMDQSQLTNNLGERGLSVNVQILREKTVPLRINGVSGNPAEGYIYNGCTTEPSRIVICGTKEALDEVSAIEIPDSAVSIEGKQAREEVTVDVLPYLPEGISLSANASNNVVVTVIIEQEGRKTIELPVGAIQINNLKEDLKLSFESDLDIELQFTGTEEALEVLDVRYAASIDLKNYKTAGTYEVTVNIETPSGVELMKNPTVKIILTEKDGG